MELMKLTRKKEGEKSFQLEGAAEKGGHSEFSQFIGRRGGSTTFKRDFYQGKRTSRLE